MFVMEPRKGERADPSQHEKTRFLFLRGDCMEPIIEIFSNLAVPVACLVACFWLWNKEREDHKEELKEVTNAIQNNTLVIQKLLDKMS